MTHGLMRVDQRGVESKMLLEIKVGHVRNTRRNAKTVRKEKKTTSKTSQRPSGQKLLVRHGLARVDPCGVKNKKLPKIKVDHV